MPERILPGAGLRAFYDPGQRNWGTSLSEDLRRLSALVQPRATSRSAALPGTGSTGQIAIVPDAAGANANALALWDQMAGIPAWVFLAPQEGWQVWITDEARFVRFAAGPLSGKLSAALLFLYFSGGRDGTMTWHIHQNARRQC